jgi:hypothetical protein
VTMLNTASSRNDGCALYCDAEVDPDDARMLANILTRYADMAERKPIDQPTAVALEEHASLYADGSPLTQ